MTLLTEAMKSVAASDKDDKSPLWKDQRTRPMVEELLLSLATEARTVGNFPVAALYLTARIYHTFVVIDKTLPKRASRLVKVVAEQLANAVSANTAEGHSMFKQLNNLITEYSASAFKIINDEEAAAAGDEHGNAAHFWERVLDPKSVNSAAASAKFQLWSRFSQLGKQNYPTVERDPTIRAKVYEAVARGETDPNAVIGINAAMLRPAAAADGADAAAAHGGADNAAAAPAHAEPAAGRMHPCGPRNPKRFFGQIASTQLLSRVHMCSMHLAEQCICLSVCLFVVL